MLKITRITTFLVVVYMIAFPPGRNVQAQERTIKSKYSFSTPELDAAQKLYSGRKYEEALAAFQLIIDKAQASSSWEELVYAMEKKALALRRLERYDDAIETMDKAIDLSLERLPKGHFLVSKMYYTRGTTDHTLRDYYNARSYLDTALVSYSNSFAYDSSAYYRMVEYKYYAYRYSEGNSDTLINYLNELKKLEEIRQKKTPRPDVVLNILQEYPTIYRQKGDFEQALAYAIQGVQYAKENRALVSNRYYAEAQYYLAQVLYYKKDYTKALEVGLGAMSIVESTPKAQMPEYYAFNNLVGTTYMALGEFDRALTYLNKAMKIPVNVGSTFDRRANLQFRAMLMINLGLCNEKLGDIRKAETYLKSSLKEMRLIALDLSPTLSGNYEQLGDFYARHNKWGESLDAYDSALRNGLDQYDASILEFPKTDGNITYSYTDLRTLAKKAESLKNVARTQENDMKVLLASKEFVEQTNKLLMKSRKDLVDSEGRLFLSKNFKRLYETGIDVSFELFNLTGSKEFFNDALYLAKQSKAILFLEQSQEIDIVNNELVPIELKEAFFESKRELENLQSRFYELIDRSFNNDSVMIVNEALLQLKKKSQSIKDTITFITSEANLSENALNMLFDLKTDNKVKKGEAQIEFFYGEESIYVFGKSETSFAFHKTESKQEIENSLEVIFSTISKPPMAGMIIEQFNDFRKHSFYLYSQLLAPVLSGLEKDLTHLIVIPDEFLSRLPFEILIQNNGSSSSGFNDLNYLIKAFNVQYELSSELLNRNPPSKKANRGLLGVGFVQEDLSTERSGYGSLLGTEEEIKYLQSAIEGTYLMGTSGTKSEFLSKAKEYDLLHLAIHGKADDVDRYRSSLIFNGGGDNTLNTNDLYLAALNARIAVLSACESGVGTVNKGEGTFSIARGFALVGVPSVVMSLWKVNDKTTSTLMTEMYSEFINNGTPINAALRHAKLDYLSEGDEYLSHPYYWAAFLQLGANVELSSDSNSSTRTIIMSLGGMFILIILILSRVRKRKRAI